MEVIYIIIGIVIGLIISLMGLFFCSIGTLRIDQSDPTDNPYMFLEIKKGTDDISKQKLVFLKVRRENFIPHK